MQAAVALWSKGGRPGANRWGAVQAAVAEALQCGGLDEPMEVPGGRALAARDFMAPPWRGRKVVLLGDTCNSDAILGASEGA